MNHIERPIWWQTLSAIAPGIIITIFAITFIWQECVPSQPVNTKKKDCRIFSQIQVVDSTGNGFEITYYVPLPVTDAEFKEIYSRNNIHQKQQKLKEEAPKHFGSLLEVDIFDFASFVIQYEEDPQVKVKTIFIYGEGKYKMYSQPHPTMPNCATAIDPVTKKGAQYIGPLEFYSYLTSQNRIYRYWECEYPYASSTSDERYIHF